MKHDTPARGRLEVQGGSGVVYGHVSVVIAAVGPPARSIKGTLHYIFEPACNNSGESGSEEGI